MNEEKITISIRLKKSTIEEMIKKSRKMRITKTMLCTLVLEHWSEGRKFKGRVE